MLVRVVGDFDLATVPILEQALARTYAGGDDVLLDASGVTFFDAASLGVLIGARHTLAERGRTLTVINPPSAVARLLSIAGLEALLAA
jgi:anti-anti-sigma factor